MRKTNSTGALTLEAHRRQDERYREGHEYDYFIIGSGSAALTVGSLLANRGHRVCLVEAHDTPGGYAHTFTMGEYSFCAQVHYIWGCGPGGRIFEFLRRIGLEKEITFELMEKDGYDHVILPDGKRVKIPYGFDRLARNIDEAYPGQREPVERFLNTVATIRREMAHIPSGPIQWWRLLPKLPWIKTIARYRNATVEQLFDDCNVSREARAVLMADAGDFMAPPSRLSVFPYTGLFGGYNTGAYYPTRHFRHYTGRLAEFISGHEGCHIYYETETTAIHTENGRIAGVETRDGKRFTARHYICNMDPQRASDMIGREHFPKARRKPLEYDYSPSGVVMYLGLKDIELREYGFGSHNTWHLEQWDMNRMWEEQAAGNFDKPWVFMSTPTLHTDVRGTTPEGGQILELASYMEYQPFKDRLDQSYSDYQKLKNRIAGRMLDIAEEKHIPNLRDHIALKVVGTPVTSEAYCRAPLGNAYGSMMTPENVGPGRLKADTPFDNLHWCNASSGWAGIYGTVLTGMDLYADLTGDRFYDDSNCPSDEAFIAALP